MVREQVFCGERFEQVSRTAILAHAVRHPVQGAQQGKCYQRKQENACHTCRSPKDASMLVGYLTLFL